MSGASLEALERALGYAFRDAALLETALTHPSYAHEHAETPSNERLEFLGDAVLDLIVARQLYEAHPEWPEGHLTRARSALVNRRALAERARALDLGSHVRLGRTEQLTAGAQKRSILGNLFEAVIGALFLDGGLPAATRYVEAAFGDDVRTAARQLEPDAKTRFQEWAHARLRVTPTYQALADSGAEADPSRYEVEVQVHGEAWGRGVGRTKRQAERAAAEQALHRAESEAG